MDFIINRFYWVVLKIKLVYLYKMFRVIFSLWGERLVIMSFSVYFVILNELFFLRVILK